MSEDGADDRNPDYPVLFTIETFEDAATILTQTQPGPFLGGEMWNEMFIDLETLVKLGEAAAKLLEAQE